MASTRLVKCDATFISVSSGNVVALATGCSIRSNRELIDCTAPKDAAKVRRACQVDFEVQVTKLVAAEESLGDIFLTGGDIVFSADTMGKTFYGVTLASSYDAAWDDPVNEALTLQCSEGLAPTFTA